MGEVPLLRHACWYRYACQQSYFFRDRPVGSRVMHHRVKSHPYKGARPIGLAAASQSNGAAGRGSRPWNSRSTAAGSDARGQGRGATIEYGGSIAMKPAIGACYWSLLLEPAIGACYWNLLLKPAIGACY